jgi:GNAT superfamily N-acetyltransferase
MTSLALTAITGGQRQKVLSVLRLAFSMDPAVRWVYPDPAQYLDLFEEFAMGFAGAAFEHGSAYLMDDGSGAALWLPPGVGSDDAALTLLFERTLSERRGELEAVFAQMVGSHPEEPHWYLPLMGVDPLRQRRGIGTDLLKEALERCDREGRRAYLEATNEGNARLYAHHGFEVTGTVEVDGRTLLWPMVRAAR